MKESELKGLVLEALNNVLFPKNDNDKKTVNEVFGLSQKEKDLKQLKIKIQQAFNEINAFNFKSLFYQPGNGNQQELTQRGLEIRVKQAGDDLPTFRELIPELFDKQIRAIRVKCEVSESEIIDGLIPDTFGSIYDSNYFIINDTGKYYAKLELHKKFPDLVKYHNMEFIMDNKYLN